MKNHPHLSDPSPSSLTLPDLGFERSLVSLRKMIQDLLVVGDPMHSSSSFAGATFPSGAFRSGVAVRIFVLIPCSVEASCEKLVDEMVALVDPSSASLRKADLLEKADRSFRQRNLPSSSNLSGVAFELLPFTVYHSCTFDSVESASRHTCFLTVASEIGCIRMVCFSGAAGCYSG